MSDSRSKACWLFHLLQEFGLTDDKSITINVDNKGVEALARNPLNHCCTKHIHQRSYFVQGCVKGGIFKLNHVSTKEMLADILTKGLGRVLVEKHRASLNVV